MVRESGNNGVRPSGLALCVGYLRTYDVQKKKVCLAFFVWQTRQSEGRVKSVNGKAPRCARPIDQFEALLRGDRRHYKNASGINAYDYSTMTTPTQHHQRQHQQRQQRQTLRIIHQFLISELLVPAPSLHISRPLSKSMLILVICASRRASSSRSAAISLSFSAISLSFALFTARDASRSAVSMSLSFSSEPIARFAWTILPGRPRRGDNHWCEKDAKASCV